MTRLIFFTSVLFLSFDCRSQLDSIQLKDIIRNKCIYSTYFDIRSTTNYQTFSGTPKGSTSARSLIIDFKVGVDGYMQSLGRKGKHLKEAIKIDSEALTELNKAYSVHLKRKRIYNTLEYVCYGTAVASAIVLFLGADNFESDGVTPPLVIGGIGVLGSVVGITIFHKSTDIHMDKWAASVKLSIQIYNTNLMQNKYGK